MRKLNKKFFERPTLEIASRLLGCCLIHEAEEGTTVGRIVETEAYLWNDPASHSFIGKTPRNSVMFDEAGKAYVYFIYGNHYCVNLVTNKKGVAEAVLIRALEPICGIELMKKRRGLDDVRQLCNGPGKLTQAMKITNEQNGSDLVNGKLRIEYCEKEKFNIVCTTRIGIVKGAELPHRFFISGNRFVSRRGIS